MLLTTDRDALKATSDACLIEAQQLKHTTNSTCSDVFFWFEDGQRKIAVLPWVDAHTRAVNIARHDLAWMNAEPLPNGIAIGQAYLAGMIAHDATAVWSHNNQTA